MTEQFLFLREIDSEDGRIEVSRGEGIDYVRISFGCFNLDVDDVDERAVTGLMTRVLATPAKELPVVELCSTEDLHIGTTHVPPDPHRVWISSGMCHAVLSLGTLRLLVDTLVELRNLHQQHQLRTKEASPC